MTDKRDKPQLPDTSFSGLRSPAVERGIRLLEHIGFMINYFSRADISQEQELAELWEVRALIDEVAHEAMDCECGLPHSDAENSDGAVL